MKQKQIIILITLVLVAFSYSSKIYATETIHYGVKNTPKLSNIENNPLEIHKLHQDSGTLLHAEQNNIFEVIGTGLSKIIKGLFTSTYIESDIPLGNNSGYTVTGLISSTRIIINNSFEVELAGIKENEKKSINKAAIQYIYDNLLNKKVTLEIDIEPNTETIPKVYIYDSSLLINSEIIKEGILELNNENTLLYNTKYKLLFEEYSIYAKENKKGIYHTGYVNINSEYKPIPNVINPYVPYNNEQLNKDIEILEQMYPALIETETIGTSVEGREIKLMKLGKGEIKIHLNGTLHAREYFATTALMKMIEDYAYAYHTGEQFGEQLGEPSEENTEYNTEEYNIREILDKVTIHIIPMVNPDGANIAQNGFEGAKNPDNVKEMKKVNPFWAYKDNSGNKMTTKFTYDWWKGNANGVDLNNHFSAGWEEYVSTRASGPASEGFKGYTPETEPEVKAVVKSIYDNDADYEIYAALHTKGQIIYWGDHTVNEEEMKIIRPMTEGLAKVTGYDMMPLGTRHTGGFSDWVRSKFDKPGYTIELTPPGLYSSFDHKNFDEEYKHTKYIGIYLAKSAKDIVENRIEIKDLTE